MMELLTSVNSSYLVALAVLVCLIIEGIKRTEVVPVKWLSLIAGLVGYLLGCVIAVIYKESITLTGLNGGIAGLVAAGGFDCLKVLWHLPEGFK